MVNDELKCIIRFIGPTACPRSPLTTLNLNNLKIKSCLAKPNTYLRLGHLFLILNIMLKVVLLEIYEQNKFSAQVPKISCFAYSHVLTVGLQMQVLFITKPNIVYKMLVSVLFDHLSHLVDDSRALSPVLIFCFVSCKGTSLSLSAKCCAQLISYFMLFRKSTDRSLWTFQYCASNCIYVNSIISRFSVHHCEVHPAQIRFSKNLLTTARVGCFKSLPCLRSKSKCFYKLCTNEIDFFFSA